MANLIGTGTYTYANGGCCYRCGRNSQLLDTDCHIPGEGALALCAPCVLEFTEAAGLSANVAFYQEVMAELAQGEVDAARIPELEAQVASLKVALATALEGQEVAQRMEAKLTAALNRAAKAARTHA